MCLIDLLVRWREGNSHPTLLTLVAQRVKNNDFYHLYTQQYLTRLFSELEKISELAKFDENLIHIIRENFTYELACHYNGKVVSGGLKEIIKKVIQEAVKVSKNGDVVVNMEKIPKPTARIVENKKKVEIEEYEQ